MDTPPWFADLPVLGEFSLGEAAAALRDVGDDETASILDLAQESADLLDIPQAEHSPIFGNHSPDHTRSSIWWPFRDRPWQFTSHTYGYLGPAQPGRDILPVHPISSAIATPELRNTRVKITLDRLYVAAYPGRDSDTHLILVHFFAKDQVSKKTEDVYFNFTCYAKNWEYAAIRNYPIFVGLKVGSEGLIFGGFTINVKNNQDEAFLKFLQSDVFKAGLHLTATAQPVLAPFLAMAKAVAEMITVRNRKRLVQKFGLGLDFGSLPTGAPLAEGAYLAVQIPRDIQTLWNWNDWVYHRGADQIVRRDDHQQIIPYNHFVFGISRYQGA